MVKEKGRFGKIFPAHDKFVFVVGFLIIFTLKSLIKNT